MKVVEANSVYLDENNEAVAVFTPVYYEHPLRNMVFMRVGESWLYTFNWADDPPDWHDVTEGEEIILNTALANEQKGIFLQGMVNADLMDWFDAGEAW